MQRWVRRSPLLVALVVALVLLAGCGGGDGVGQKSALWHCPMHPSYISDSPGSCPICGMSLVQGEESEKPAAPGSRRVLFYRNPMNPTVTSPVPA